MSRILGFVKANLVIVILCAVMVLVLPAGIVLSSMWNASIREKQQAAAEDALKKVSASKVTYTLPALAPGAEPVRLNAAPNARLTEWFREQRAAQAAQAAAVVEAGVERNRDGHQPLMPGLFPEPPPLEADFMMIDFCKMFIPSGDPGKPSVYEALLASINAGGPADPVELHAAIDDLRAAELEKAQAEGTALTPGQTRELVEKLVARRLAEYRRRAQEVSVYATLDMFSGRFPFFWRTQPQQPPKIHECFVAQADYWLVEDLLGAVRIANSGPDGEPLPVEDAVIKRIERLEVEPLPIYGRTGPGSESGAGATGGAAGAAGLPPTNPALSVTGRYTSPENQVYDVRRARLTLIVSSERLPLALAAFRRANFMEVLDVDISEIDLFDDLKQGYYYGPEHVVQLDVMVETVWLRRWTVPFMPRIIKSKLGVVEPEAPATQGTTPG